MTSRAYLAPFGLLALATLLCCTVCLAVPPEPSLITLHEAEILIYLIPEAHELRKQGMDVGWELETGSGMNQEDFYIFSVANVKRRRVHGSAGVGFFAVNKHTADVWDAVAGELVTSSELEGVQRILRKAHLVDSATISKYSGRRPFVPSRDMPR